jgi:hypothetical protein
MKTNIEHKTNLLNSIQNILSLIIIFLILIGLIPFLYNDIYQNVILLLTIQILISLLRVRLINIFFEIIIIIFLSIAALPLFISIKIIAIPLAIVLYIFKIFALIIAMLDLSAQRGTYVYKNINIKKQENKQKPKIKKAKKYSSNNIKDAQFKEK